MLDQRRPWQPLWGIVVAMLAQAPLALARQEAKAPQEAKPRLPAPAKGDYTVHEWSVWIADPSGGTLNARERFRSMLPSFVDTTRPSDAKLAKETLAPISLLTFRGPAAEKVEIEYQLKSTRLVAHWPKGEIRHRRLRWLDVQLTSEPVDAARYAYVSDDHWFHAARGVKSALGVQVGARAERFFAWDAEIPLAAPIRLEGGPKRFRIANTTPYILRDVVLIAPKGDGRRLAWVGDLPAAKSEAKTAAQAGPAAEAGSKAEATKVAPKEAPVKAAKIKQAPPAAVAKAPAAAKQPAAKPAAKAIANPKASEPAEPASEAKKQTEQKLDNSRVGVNFGNTPLKNVIRFVEQAGQITVRFDPSVSDKLTQSVNLSVNSATLRSVLEDVLKQVELDFGVDQNGTVRVPKPESVVAPKPLEPVKWFDVHLEPAATGADRADQTTGELQRRLLAAGLDADQAALLLAMYARPLFEAKEWLVVARLGTDALDEIMPLEVFPEAKQRVRLALVVVRGIDPGIKIEVAELIRKLGDDSYEVREAAEKRLVELGTVAIEPLRAALKEKDLEIVFRAERILLAQKQGVD